MRSMKYQQFLFLVVMLSLNACKPDPQTSAYDLFDHTDFVASPVVPDLNSNTVNLLINTFWVAEHWVDHADGLNNKKNKGRWWRFSKDGTFVTGQWEETLSKGVWVIHLDQDRVLLHLDADSAPLNMEFHIQQIAQSGEYMSWAGTTTYEMNRIAVKAISLLTIPTKEQFGFKD